MKILLRVYGKFPPGKKVFHFNYISVLPPQFSRIPEASLNSQI